jgi:hypothetical protein
MIEVKVDNKAVNYTLNRLARAAANPCPAFLGIGESMVLSTKRRFETVAIDVH